MDSSSFWVVTTLKWQVQLFPTTTGEVACVMHTALIELGVPVFLIFVSFHLFVSFLRSTLHQHPPTPLVAGSVDLDAACNLQCGCTSNFVEPVCGADGITYFSPCHAGCTQMLEASVYKLQVSEPSSLSLSLELYPSHCITFFAFQCPQNYTSCACIQMPPVDPGSPPPSAMASSGSCPSDCQTLIPFMMMVFLMTFVVSCTQMPLLMITLRYADLLMPLLQIYVTSALMP